MNWNKYSDETLQAAAKGCMTPTLCLTILLASIIWLCGCKTKTVVVEKIVPEIHYQDVVKVQKDSIYLHDSIFNTEYLQGDTIVKYKYAQKTLFRERVLHDTVIKVDSIPYEVKTTVERKKTDYKGWFAFGGLLFLIVLYVVYRIRK